jgi:hypothetical protein
LARDQKRRKLLDDTLERRAAIHQVIFVVTVAITLLVAVVLVDDDAAVGWEHQVGADAAEVENALSRFFVAQKIQHIRALRGREFRMGVIYIKACPVGQDFIDRHIVLLVGHIVIIVELKAPCIHEWIFLVVVP